MKNRVNLCGSKFIEVDTEANTVRSNLSHLTGEDTFGNDLDPTGNAHSFNKAVTALESFVLDLATSGYDISRMGNAIDEMLESFYHNLPH